MQNRSAVSLYKKTKSYVFDCFSEHKMMFVIYAICVLAGIALGIILGIKLLNNSVNFEPENYILLILSNDGSLISAFAARILTFVILLLFSVLVLLNYKWGVSLYVMVVVIMMKSFRDAVCLIGQGGLDKILGGILFYVIFDLIFVIVLSIFAVNIIIYSRRYSCSKSKKELKTAIKSLVLLFLIPLLVVFLYCIIASFIFKFFVI